MPFMSSGENLVERDAGHGLPERRNLFHCPFDPGPALVDNRHKMGNWLTAPCDREAFAARYLAQQLQEPGLRLG